MDNNEPIEMFREALEASGLRMDDSNAHVVDASELDVTDWALRRRILQVESEDVDLRAIALPGYKIRRDELTQVLSGQ